MIEDKKIPNGWKVVTLGEVLDIKNGKSRPNDGKTYPVYGGNGILGHADEYNIDGKTIVVGRVGAYCGSIFLEKEKFWLSDNALGVLAKEGFDIDYLYYLLKKINLNKHAIGGAQPLLTQGVINQIEVLTPEKEPEQRAIAAVLSSFDDKIELLREQNKTLEATAQAIFKEWFVNFNFLNEQGKPYKSSGGKMVDSELGEVPKGWRIGRIKDLVDILSGFAFSSSDFSQDGKYKLVTIKNVQDRYFDTETKDRLASFPAKMPDYCKLYTGDILLSLTGNVGRICLVNGDNFLLNQRVAKLKEKNPNDYSFTYLLFLQDSIFSLLQSTASGTAQQNLSPIQTKEIEIIIADRKILDQFGIVVNKLIQKINGNNSQIQTLSKLRDTLLPKLIKGEVRVKGFND